jgi:hypothetical protein
MNLKGYKGLQILGFHTRSDGASSPTTWWAIYALTPDATYGTAQGAVWSDFWVRFLAILFQIFIPDAPNFANA